MFAVQAYGSAIFSLAQSRNHGPGPRHLNWRQPTALRCGLGVTITGADGATISLCPLDHPLVSLDTPGIWKFSLDFVPKKPIVFLNLYNNQWNTNYRYWYSGTWSSRVRIWLEQGLAVPALEGRVPLLGAAATGSGGRLPAARAGVSVSRPGVLVTAFGSPPALKGTLLRIWEVAGKTGFERK